MAAKPKPPTRPPKADWEAIERDYRTTKASVREIARAHGLAENAIRKRAKRLGWTRDVAGAYRAEVRNEVVRTQARTPKPVSERETVERAAERAAGVVGEHLERVSKLKGVADVIHRLVEAWLIETDEEKRTEAAKRLFALKGDTLGSAIRVLGDATERIQRLERLSLGLDEQQGAGQDGENFVPLEERLKAYADGAEPAAGTKGANDGKPEDAGGKPAGGG